MLAASSSMAAEAKPAFLWSRTVTISVNPASRWPSPMALRCAAVIAARIPPEHDACRWVRSDWVIFSTASSAFRIAWPYVSNPQFRFSAVGFRHEMANTCTPCRTKYSIMLRPGAMSMM